MGTNFLKLLPTPIKRVKKTKGWNIQQTNIFTWKFHIHQPEDLKTQQATHTWNFFLTFPIIWLRIPLWIFFVLQKFSLHPLSALLGHPVKKNYNPYLKYFFVFIKKNDFWYPSEVKQFSTYEVYVFKKTIMVCYVYIKKSFDTTLNKGCGGGWRCTPPPPSCMRG